MQMLRAPATQCRSAAAPQRPSVALPLRRMSVVRRFKEDDKESSLASKNVISGANANTTGSKSFSADYKVPAWIPAFTRRREVFASRLAMVGFFAAVLVEIAQPGHLGPIGQVSYWTGLDKSLVTYLIGGIIAYNVLGGLGPWSPTFSEENQRDVQKRPNGPNQDATPVTEPNNFFGFSGWGFTKRNEIFAGRLAMLGFLAAVVQEVRMGGVGPFGQIAGYLGWTPDSTYYATVNGGLWISIVAVLALATFFPSRFQDPSKPEDDIY